LIVADTAISNVLGADGDLRYRGRSIEEWVTQPFTDVAAAVLEIDPDLNIDVAAALLRLGALNEREVDLVRGARAVHPMALLQGITPLLERAPADDAITPLGDAAQGLVIAAKLPQILALHMACNGTPIPYPTDPDYGLRFLQQIPDAPRPLTQPAADAFNITQILQLEHSLNAGTFAVRVVASTLAGIEAAIAAGFGALSGILHGGADQAAIEMADAIGTVERAADHVAQALERGEKIMGMGHREYKVLDPRSTHVKRLAAALSRGTRHAETFAILQAVENAFGAEMKKRGKPLHANMDFYKGVVYRCLGIEDRYFTAMFATARVFGYVAHFIESRRDNRLIRPAARYIGK
jgi:citrate synthase